VLGITLERKESVKERREGEGERERKKGKEGEGDVNRTVERDE
jgi:hypothetical protein